MQRRVMTRLLALATALGLGSVAWAGTVVQYYHTDAIGNVRVVTDQAKNVVERHDYLPFGEECTTGACATNPGLTGGQPKHFTGKERDKETGLDYFGARYYASKIGRFTTTDPVYTWQENLVDPQRWNRYAYARNNPFRYVDPDGRELRTTEISRMQEVAGPAAGGIKIVNGKLDVSGMQSSDLSGNEGAALLFEMATSQSVYTYAEGKTIETRAGPRNVNGGSNLDSLYDSRLDYKGGKGPESLPPAGVDAAIVIDPSVRHVTSPGGRSVSGAASTFHELAEAQGRVERRLSYQDAHSQAGAREKTLVQQRPGFTAGLAGDSLRRVPEKK